MADYIVSVVIGDDAHESFQESIANNLHDCEVVAQCIIDAGAQAFYDGYTDEEAPFVEDMFNNMWLFGWREAEDEANQP